MKKLFFLLGIVALIYPASVLAVKPTNKESGAVKYGWHLSGDVMPVPPYGSVDIPGSDTASKLIVNKPSGSVEAMVTGVMNGLTPNTEYTVYLSNKFTPYTTSLNVQGAWGFDFLWQGAHYIHSATLAQSDSTVTGDGGYPFGSEASYHWTITSGSITGNNLHLEMAYDLGVSCTMTMDGVIAGDGSIGGTWTDNCAGTRTSTWTSSSGTALVASGDTGWPGLLPGLVPFTFMTDEYGSGSWHYNFAEAPAEFSVWVNSAATILVSESIKL